MENSYGRPVQKDYGQKKLMQELIDTVIEAYRNTNESKATALAFSLPPNNYLPYTKIICKPSEINQNAERAKRYKLRRQSVSDLQKNCKEENLWNCIVAFQGYHFYTSSGLPFTYTLKVGRNGEFTKELFIDRRENSKSLTWSSVKIAFERVREKRGTVFDRPKAVADVRGISYSYSLLWRFGMIEVPEKAEKKLRGIK